MSKSGGVDGTSYCSLAIGQSYFYNRTVPTGYGKLGTCDLYFLFASVPLSFVSLFGVYYMYVVGDEKQSHLHK